MLFLLPHAPAGQAIWQGLGVAAGTSALIITAIRVLHQRNAKLLFLLAWTGLFAAACHFSLSVTYHISHAQRTFDAELYRIDLAMGGNPIAFWGELVQLRPWLNDTLWHIYLYLPAALIAAYAAQRRWRPEREYHYLLMLGLSCVATLLYAVVPAIGPTMMFGGNFPFFLPEIAANLENRDGMYIVCNAMPSLHITWALLAVYSVAGTNRWVHASGLAFLALTVMAVLSNGQHYLIDLIVAYPLSVALFAAGGGYLEMSRPRRLKLAGAALVIVLLWLLAIRYAATVIYSVPGLALGAALLTVALAAAIKYALDKRIV